MSKSIDFGSEITGKIKDAIKAKLAELGSYIDEELPDYIMIMIANRKSKAQMVEDLQLFLNNNTDSFVTWLQDMLQQLEALSSSTAAATATASSKTPLHSSSSKKLEKQLSVEQKQDKRRSSENLPSKTTRSESDESGQSRNADTSFRQELDVKGGEDDLGIEKPEKSEETAVTSHHRPHHVVQKRRESSPVFDEDEPSPTKQPAVSLRRRAVEQVPASRKSDSRRRSRSKTPPPPTRRSRDSRSRSRSPRGSHYSKRIVASVLASRQRERDDGRRAAAISSSTRRSGHDRRSRDSPTSDTDHDNETSAVPVSSSVRVAQRKPAVSANLQPTTSLLMRAIAEAKSSIEGVPQSEIKVPPNSSLAASKSDLDKERQARERKGSDEEEERDVPIRPRRRGVERGERAGDRAIKSLHVLSTSDGGFLSASKQAQMKRQEERKKQIMSKLLLRQIEQEEQQLAETEEPKKEPEEEKPAASAAETKSEKSEKVVEEEEKKKEEDDEAVRAFNQTAVKDKSTKTVYLDQSPSLNVAAAAATEVTSSDVLMKALFRSSSDSSEKISIPLAPNKNHPQFIVTLEGVDESMFSSSLQQQQPIVIKPKLPLSQRLEPRPAQSIESRLGPPIKIVESSMEQDVIGESQQDIEEMQADFGSENVNSNNDTGNISNQVQSDVEMKSANRPAERCRFWPNCKAGETCAFVHPSQPCKAFPNCRFGARCLYIHPNCKFDAACLNPECPYTHYGNAPATAVVQPATVAPVPLAVSQTTVTSVPPAVPTTTAPSGFTAPTGPIGAAVPPAASSIPLCKYFPNCTNPFCLFSHPKPCRFGASCYHKKTCTFWHPPSVVPGATAAASKLRWTAPSVAQSSSSTTAPTAAAPNNVNNTAEPPSAATAAN